MSIKIKQSLVRSLDKIKSKSFDEETIRTLLITAREFLKYEGLIKELAHFIAHTNRNRGIFHKKVNNRYTKMKLVEEQFFSEDFQKIGSQIKTEDQLSDLMLNGISVDKIDAKLFDILYRDGLEDIREDHLIKYTGFTKKEAEKYLYENYIKIEGYFYLKALRTQRNAINLLFLARRENKSDFELENSVKQAVDLTDRIKNTVDILQRVIRGVIFYDSVFEAKSLNNEFASVFESVLKTFDIDLSYIQDINDNADDLLLCIMTLIHDSTFEFYDKNTASIYLCAYRAFSAENPFSENSETIFEEGVFALYINYNFKNKSNSYPLFVSELKIKNYITIEDFNEIPINRSMEKIPWISAERINGELKLKS